MTNWEKLSEDLVGVFVVAMIAMVVIYAIASVAESLISQAPLVEKWDFDWDYRWFSDHMDLQGDHRRV